MEQSNIVNQATRGEADVDKLSYAFPDTVAKEKHPDVADGKQRGPSGLLIGNRAHNSTRERCLKIYYLAERSPRGMRVRQGFHSIIMCDVLLLLTYE